MGGHYHLVHIFVIQNDMITPRSLYFDNHNQSCIVFLLICQSHLALEEVFLFYWLALKVQWYSHTRELELKSGVSVC